MRTAAAPPTTAAETERIPVALARVLYITERRREHPQYSRSRRGGGFFGGLIIRGYNGSFFFPSIYVGGEVCCESEAYLFRRA